MKSTANTTSMSKIQELSKMIGDHDGELQACRELQGTNESYTEQLKTYVKDGHYLKKLNKKNEDTIKELDSRVLKILNFGNSITEFEDKLNEREGNALRLLAEPELDYTAKRAMIIELEEGIKKLEAEYSPLPLDSLRDQISEIITKTVEMEAENAIREIDINFRENNLLLRKKMQQPLPTAIPEIVKPEFKETEVKASFDCEKERMDKLLERAEKIAERKLKILNMKREIEETQRQKEEVERNGRQVVEEKTQKIETLKTTMKLYDEYSIKLDNIALKSFREEIAHEARKNEDNWKMNKLESSIRGAEKTVPDPGTYIADARVEFNKGRAGILGSEKLSVNSNERRKRVRADLRKAEGKLEDTRARVDAIEEEIKMYLKKIENDPVDE
jgi:hypothetical protein